VQLVEALTLFEVFFLIQDELAKRMKAKAMINLFIVLGLMA
jgi:hypothetical protein